MYSSTKSFFVASLFFLPVFAFAATAGSLIDGITGVIASFIPILMSLAVLAFFWGLVKFINHAGDEKSIEEGKQLMIWGMIALFVMVALWGIIGWIQSELGLTVSTSLGTLPQQANSIPSGAPPSP